MLGVSFETDGGRQKVDERVSVALDGSSGAPSLSPQMASPPLSHMLALPAQLWNRPARSLRENIFSSMYDAAGLTSTVSRISPERNAVMALRTRRR